MKKSMILLGLLGIGYANAQEGNVGINTEDPKATLHIQPSAENLTKTTNEGIIAPKLSKERIAGIADANLVEGTLVYATDAIYAGTNAKVVKITEKGYYFYNGTEWVKVQHTDTNTELWAQRDNGVKETYLKPASEDGNEFFYSENNGVFYRGKSSDNAHTGISGMDHAGLYLRRHNAVGYGPAVLLTSGRGTLDIPETNKAGDNLGRIITAPTIDPNISSGWASTIHTIMTEVKSPTSYSTNLILGARSLTGSTPAGLLFIEGANNRVGIGTGAPQAKLDVVGTLRANTTTIHGQGPLGSVINLVNTSKDTDTEVNRWTFYNLKETDASPYRAGLAIFGYDAKNQSTYSKPRFIITDSGNIGIGSRYAYKANPEVSEALTVDGNIKATSLEGTGSRPVFATADGVLTTEGSSSAIQVGNTDNITCTAANAGTMNYKEVERNGQQVGVFGFCIRKGSDYVWAYMAGGSNIFGTSANGAAFGEGL